MPRETTTLPTETSPHTAALGYLAVLAYPDSTTDRDSFIAAGHAWITRQLPPGPLRHELEARLPAVRKRDVETRLARAFKRITTRRQWAAAEVQQELLRGPAGPLPTNPSRGRKARVAALASRSHRNPGNEYARVWRESAPVLHLAYVLQLGDALDTLRRPVPNPVATTADSAAAIRAQNLVRQRGQPQRMEIRLAITYTPTHNVDMHELIARPDWVRPALLEAENVRASLVRLAIVDDAGTVELRPE